MAARNKVPRRKVQEQQDNSNRQGEIRPEFVPKKI